jgi:drug/metabolite transporter (DMT)-like permease
MSDRHRDLYISKLLSGFISLIGCIFLIYISMLEAKAEAGDWYWWALAASVLLCTGIYFCIAAAAHKVKSDFNRKRRSRDSGERREEG